MTARRPLTRRALLAGALVLPLAACTPAPEPTTSPAPPPRTLGRPPARITDVPAIAALEPRFGARVGVAAIDTATGVRLAHRAHERFPFCSMFKLLAASAVLDGRAGDVERTVAYAAADLVGRSPITRERLGSALTLRELCDAALRFSDGTAGNLLLRELGGPAALTAFARELGDDVFRMDRIEPEITEATPGDERDTTSPAAYAADLDRLLLGDALQPTARDALVGMMRENRTGDARIRAAAPGWTVADRTGTGWYGTAGAGAVLWPPDGGAPVVLVVMTTRANREDAPSDALVAEAAAAALAALRPV